jgi:phage shock protein A
MELLMSILDRLHTIISADTAKLFGAAKKASVMATQDVESAKAALVAAQQKAVDLAEEARQHAEKAAAEAKAAYEELTIEAKAAAEKVAFHRSQLPVQTEPTLGPTQ